MKLEFSIRIFEVIDLLPKESEKYRHLWNTHLFYIYVDLLASKLNLF